MLNTIPPLLFLKESLGGLLGCVGLCQGVCGMANTGGGRFTEAGGMRIKTLLIHYDAKA
ncbi:TPA: hypothetical protein HID40_003556 [Escherichia coli]|nr:hypothetical protein [Escherichia coli]HAH7447523.1 hypothetical protein [Escherichia coli]